MQSNQSHLPHIFHARLCGVYGLFLLSESSDYTELSMLSISKSTSPVPIIAPKIFFSCLWASKSRSSTSMFSYSRCIFYKDDMTEYGRPCLSVSSSFSLIWRFYCSLLTSNFLSLDFALSMSFLFFSEPYLSPLQYNSAIAKLMALYLYSSERFFAILLCYFTY